MSETTKEILPAFQKFLLESKLVPIKNAPFYAYWVSRFLEYARKQELSATEYQESAVMEFLHILRSDKRIHDWQFRQADDAIRLYYFHYLGRSGNRLLISAVAVDVPGILKETKRLIRLKHYSYSTERTYLQWIERFFDYALQTGKKKELSHIGTEDFKNFISHLALKQRSYASILKESKLRMNMILVRDMERYFCLMP